MAWTFASTLDPRLLPAPAAPERELSASVLKELRPVLEQTIQRARLPGIALAVVRDHRQAEHLVLGIDAAGSAIRPDSLFPVASITKLATALAVLRLGDTAELSVDDRLQQHLPQAAAAKRGVTLRNLLAHTSGLPLDLPSEVAPYAEGLDWSSLAEACLKTPLATSPDTRVQYSNVGYGLLAQVVERRSGLSFSAALERLVLQPLGIEGYLGMEPWRPPLVVADVRSEHNGTKLEPYNSPFWRSLGLPWGGLITTLDGALCIVRAFGDTPPGFLRPETLAEATRNQVGDLGGGFVPPMLWPRSPWGLGPELRGRKSPHWAPAQACAESFGHAGASGCLAWSDPSAHVAWAMFATRTADSGWLIQHGPAIGEAVLASVGSASATER